MSRVIANVNDVEVEYRYEYGTPDTEGHYLDISIRDILEQKEVYLELLNILNVLSNFLVCTEIF